MIRRAGDGDLPVLLELIEQFYVIDRHHYDRIRITRALAPLLASDEIGQVWLIGHAGETVGYAVVTWGYSLESGGRDALLDEIYVAARSQGIGGQALMQILGECRRAGASRMFLETEAHNADVRRFYSRHGFAVENSIWMSRQL
jgi:GNAT superfamily N-acetyltransferase